MNNIQLTPEEIQEAQHLVETDEWKKRPAGDFIWGCGENIRMNEDGSGDVVDIMGGCGKDVNLVDAYRCTDCGVYFHRDCLEKHFEEDSIRKCLKSLREKLEEMKKAEWRGEAKYGIQAAIDLITQKL